MESTRCWNQIGTHGDATCSKLSEVVHCRNCSVYTDAALGLLDRELPAGYMDEWARHFSVAQSVQARGESSVFIFRLGEEWLAISTTLLSEVCSLRPIHSLPHRRNGLILGVTNVRGELLICVSLAALLGIQQPADADQQPRNLRSRLLVIGQDSERFVFPADEVFGIHRYHTGHLLEAPATVGKAVGTYTRTVLDWQDHTVGILETKSLIEALNRSLT